MYHGSRRLLHPTAEGGSGGGRKRKSNKRKRKVTDPIKSKMYKVQPREITQRFSHKGKIFVILKDGAIAMLVGNTKAPVPQQLRSYIEGLTSKMDGKYHFFEEN